MQHRLSVAGGGAAVSFAPKSLARIHRYTAGIPRLINLLCDRALLSGYSAHTNRIVPDYVDSAADSLELQRPRAHGARLGAAALRRVRGRHDAWPRSSTAGGATMWHYREYAGRLVRARAAADRVVRAPDYQTSDQLVADHHQ